MKLILTRHGETVENVQRIYQGNLPGRLSRNGISQVKKLALRLKDEKIDAIYSSDLARAADTAKEIVKYYPDIPISFVKELRECDVGSFTGKKDFKIDWNNDRPADVETRRSMRRRSKRLLGDVYKKYPNNTVLFVGHGGINIALITMILNKPEGYMNEIEDLYNTSVCIFEIKEDKNHKVHLMNCIKHLS